MSRHDDDGEEKAYITKMASKNHSSICEISLEGVESQRWCSTSHREPKITDRIVDRIPVLKGGDVRKAKNEH